MTFDAIKDLAVDSNYEVYIDHTGNLATVKGRAAFEQKMAIRLTEEMQGIIGGLDVDKATIREIAVTKAKRIAEQQEEVDELHAVETSFSGEAASTLEMEIIYNTGERLTFDIEL